ncbi:CATRA conflict system CASPASE/TPR repeat-associated protein [Amycolatopsis sp. cg9]|uniref:CATRA conflict system CASPASE/TPR repeat-associated protein n=1 Tax=Amycolatopsis sp. cg9 TaxID=3238801 RepID=UPI003524D607
MNLHAPALLCYVFLPLDGPHSGAAQARVGSWWRHIRTAWRFDAPIEPLGVPADPAPGALVGGSRLVAACQGEGGIRQAAIRAEHDVLCLTVMLAPPPETEVEAGWAAAGRQLAELDLATEEPELVGVARIHLALTDGPPRTAGPLVRAAAPAPGAVGWSRRFDGLELASGAEAALWESHGAPDDRASRQLYLVAPTAAEREVDHLVWTVGDGELVPFARHAMHLARLRYQLRVFERSEGRRQIRTRLDESEDRVRAAATPSPEAVAHLVAALREAETISARVERMRRTVRAIADRAALPAGIVPAGGTAGPLTDDLVLTSWFATRLDDEVARLTDACAHARDVLGDDRGRVSEPVRGIPPSGAPDGGKPLVFISYIHDSPQHKAAVAEFGRLLLAAGVDARLDQWVTGRRQDWYRWMLGLVSHADFVIVVASPLCRRVGDGQVPNDRNLGGQSEMTALRELLQQDRERWTPKLLPAVLPGHDWRDLPLFLQPSTADHYEIGELTPAGIGELLQVITAGAA